MSLRLRINLLVTLLMLLLAALLGWKTMADARQSIREEIEAASKVTVHLLSGVVHASNLSPTPRPFLYDLLTQLGRVRANHIRLWDETSNSLVYESPPSKYKAGRDAPEWYARLVRPDSEPVTIRLRGARIEVIPDPSRAILDAWDDLRILAAVAGASFVVVNLLVFWFVSRSLKPLAEVLNGLAEMRGGRLHARLPEFSAPEFRRIGESFNGMAAQLEETIAAQVRAQVAERELKESREIANVVRAEIEAERRAIAQELHDELGQCVTAIRTIAEAIAVRAGEAAPEIRAQAHGIKEIAARTYSGMQAIVQRLRPAELDRLGLAATLRATMDGFAARHPAIHFALAVEGDLEPLAESVRLAVFRIVQEAVNNTVRHSGAANVRVAVNCRPDGELELTIRDDGNGNLSLAKPGGGFGLRGMRERVQSLDGEFAAGPAPGGGAEVRAIIPLAERAAA